MSEYKTAYEEAMLAAEEERVQAIKNATDALNVMLKCSYADSARHVWRVHDAAVQAAWDRYEAAADKAAKTLDEALRRSKSAPTHVSELRIVLDRRPAAARPY